MSRAGHKNKRLHIISNLIPMGRYQMSKACCERLAEERRKLEMSFVQITYDKKTDQLSSIMCPYYCAVDNAVCSLPDIQDDEKGSCEIIDSFKKIQR